MKRSLKPHAEYIIDYLTKGFGESVWDPEHRPQAVAVYDVILGYAIGMKCCQVEAFDGIDPHDFVEDVLELMTRRIREPLYGKEEMG